MKAGQKCHLKPGNKIIITGMSTSIDGWGSNTERFIGKEFEVIEADYKYLRADNGKAVLYITLKNNGTFSLDPFINITRFKRVR